MTLIVQRAQSHDKVLTVHPGVTGTPAAPGIQMQRRLQPRGPAGQPSPPPPPPPAVAPAEVVNEQELLHTMNELANPVKKTTGGGGGSPDASGPGGLEFMDDDDDDNGYNDEHAEYAGGEDDDESGGGGESEVGVDDDEFGAAAAAAPMPQPPPGAQPSDGFRTLEEEKSDIMFKLQRLHRQGVKGLRAFTPYSDIRDMRAELNRVRTELELERSVKFQRKILMAIVSALEWGNSKFNPFDLELDGWSEQMHQSVQSSTEYDGIFEELFFKYRGKVATPPEIRLLLMVGGSAMMFHMTKAMMKSALPNLGDLMRANPAMMDTMMKSFAPQQQPSQQQPAAQPPPDGARREMRGPGIDVGGLGGLAGLGGGGGLPGLAGLFGGGGSGPAVPPPPVPLASLQAASTRPGRPPAAQRERDDDDASDRLSDVISDDLQSVPDDVLEDLNDDDAGAGAEAGAKRITVPPSRGRAKRARTSSASQKLITI